MFDRLLALTMALMLAAGAIVQPPCCCKSPVSVCHLDAQADDKPACCVTDAEAPACRQQKGVVGVESLPCECDGCLTNLPENVLNESATAPRAPSIDDLPLAQGAGPMDPPQVVSLNETLRVGWESLSLDRPPPDRQALLCVWVI